MLTWKPLAWKIVLLRESVDVIKLKKKLSTHSWPLGFFLTHDISKKDENVYFQICFFCFTVRSPGSLQGSFSPIHSHSVDFKNQREEKVGADLRGYGKKEIGRGQI